MTPIKKILVANRGEIALRVMRSAREMGIATAAVFSEVDRQSPHVRYADEAFCLGDAPASESYLAAEKIITACKALHVDAIHPGYGFLSENAAFAQAVADAGLIFIGPSPKSIELMGDKLAAKHAAATYHIPMVPGVHEAVTHVDKAIEAARQIGYPVLIKASAGGGGKGMRVVNGEEEMEEQMQRAVSEALSAFGNGAVFVEKYISSPRHIEVQVLGDQHGNVVHLFERDCSIQRRHQKVIEEAPSAVFDEARRQAIGETAIRAAKACDYYGTGTVEFIVDRKLDFYFLEMNTRLQVEHCVTEEITGVDLVKEQIKIAEGRALEIKQSDLSIHGHALECRVYAENPKNDFLPDIGRLQVYKPPLGPGIRLDDGVEQGMDIPIHYDPMLGKLIAKGKDRMEAIERMSRAIDEFDIQGVETTLSFCKHAINHEAFVSAQFDTNFVGLYFTPYVLDRAADKDEEAIAALIALKMIMHTDDIQVDDNKLTADKNKGKWRRRAVLD